MVKVDQERFTEDFNKMLKIVPLNSLGFFFIGFLIPIITRTSMGATGIQLSLVVAIQVLGRVLGGFITGFITDRVKSRTSLVLIGSFGRCLSYFIIFAGIITNLILLLGIGTFILGFMAGVFWVPFNTLVAEKSSKSHRSQAYGKRDSFNARGQILGALLGFGLLMFGGIFTSNPIILYGSIPLFGLSNLWAGIRFYNKIDEKVIFEENLG
ncbi:MAG: MFS transporter, partial [Candidatus Lokiarchaeota archaeon]|nr:MFS transporter [Candidatus Lokiarchaeota archaeon]